MRPSYRISRVFWAVVLLVLGAVVAFCVAKGTAGRTALATRGREVQGRVESHRVMSGKSIYYQMTVAYDTPEGPRRHEFTVAHPFYDSAPVGSTLPVYYDPADPTTLLLTPVSRAGAAAFATAWWLGWALGGLCVAFLYWSVGRAAKGQLQMLTEWPAAILDVEHTAPGDSKGTMLRLSGTYQDARGQMVPVQSLSVARSVDVGRPVPILYDPASDRVVPVESLGYVELA